MTVAHTSTPDLLDRARARIAAGASASSRSEIPEVIVRTEGAHLWTAEGRRLTDYLNSWGAILIGHSDPRVNARVARAAATCDLNWVGPNPLEVELAEAICEHMPSAEKVAFFPTGTESLMHATQLVRLQTGRRRLLRFHGSYNGWHDELAVGSRFAYGETTPSPDEPNSAGLRPGVSHDVINVDWNDFGAVRDAFHAHGDEIAGVFCEPYMHTFGCVPPAPGFLELIRDLAGKHGALVVYDEVKTGFRHALGGYQAIAGVAPDLTAFGKGIGNGYALAGLAGRADVMDGLGDASATHVDINGTYNGAPYAVAAGLAVVEILREEGYERLYALGERMRSGLRDAIAAAGVTASVSGIGGSWSLYFRAAPPVNYREAALDHDHDRGERFFELMLERGVLLAPLVIGDHRMNLATSESDVDQTVEAAADALSEIAASES